MIFVTGGTGFLGSYILQELVLQGRPVRALRRDLSFPFYLHPALLDKISWVEGDLLDVTGLMENLQGCNQIIHAAGLVSFNPSDKKKLFKVNIEGTSNLVNVAIESGITDFIHVSSVSALGRNENSTSIDEEIKWPGNDGQSNYGISKYFSEMEVWRGMGEGLTPLILNPSTLLGYGDWNETSCGLFKTAYREFPWYMDGTNGFTDVEDSARAIIALMNSGIRNERFIISAENRSYREIFNWMAAGFGKKHPGRKAGPFLAGIAWRKEKIKSIFTRNKPLITRESVAIAARHTMYDNHKMLSALPSFRFRSLEDSIYEACLKYLKNPQPL
ncbi:MAG TPA: NAD-dependent epimerase/dehydratase family protein [Puia sp.]|jgi:dihydroflavonol-4-reductase|nr:NAD-dependent epimerase/dehydratase family protein [Puia sp.]